MTKKITLRSVLIAILLPALPDVAEFAGYHSAGDGGGEAA
jgi:hypothetical protein